MAAAMAVAFYCDKTIIDVDSDDWVIDEMGFTMRTFGIMFLSSFRPNLNFFLLKLSAVYTFWIVLMC
jgi:hypothetical protein